MFNCTALSQVRISRSLPSQFCFHFYERCAQCWIELNINFPIFIFWIIADCIYNLPKKFRPKKSCSKVFKFTGKMRIALKMIFYIMGFFCATLGFWDMVDLDACRDAATVGYVGDMLCPPHFSRLLISKDEQYTTYNVYINCWRNTNWNKLKLFQ